VIWKPSEKGALCAQAVQAVLDEAGTPAALSELIHGGSEAGMQLAVSEHIALVSATGSVSMGKQVAAAVGKRLGRCLLELGGNNAAILTPSADLESALSSIVFSAVGTAGQRCTTLRRLIVHESILPEVTDRLRGLYSRLTIGDPREAGVLVGPLIDERAWLNMQSALDRAISQGGTLICGGDRVTGSVPTGGFYVHPAIVKVPGNLESSAIFTNDLREAERFISPSGSDCGIANINIGTSGAEIGGAFGGEKDTGGGRESGSESWKAYMRRTTNTINYGRDLPLAQGVRFEI
jgi:aldehyde dehydrogenase (NAD+)